MVTRFSLKKATNAGGIAYSQAQFAVARVLTPEEIPYINAMAEQVKGFAAGVAYDTEQPGNEEVNPFTGEIMNPEQM